MKDSETEAVTRLEGEKRKLETIIDSIGDPFYIVGSEFKVLYENKAGIAAFGKHKGEYCYAAYHNSDRVCEGCPVDLSLKDGKIHTSEITMLTDKGILYLENTASPLKDSTGKTTSCVEVVRDITRRKKAEKASRESKELFEKTFNSQRDAIFILDSEVPATIRDHNPAATDVFGYSRQEMLGRTVGFLHVDETTLKQFQDHLYSAIAERGFIQLFEFRMRRKNGTIFPTEHTVSPLKDGRGRRIGWVSVVRDITDRKVAETALQEKEKDLEHQARHLAKVNTALQVLLDHREGEKKKLEENVLTTLRKLVLPYVEKLEKGNLDGDSQTYVSIIKSNLADFLSPFLSTLSSRYADLTPTEVEIADLIRQGKTSKDIASLLNVSCDTVSFHRTNIRKKLGLSHKKMNLRSYLLSLTS